VPCIAGSGRQNVQPSMPVDCSRILMQTRARATAAPSQPAHERKSIAPRMYTWEFVMMREYFSAPSE
jgi:hypothetical protein